MRVFPFIIFLALVSLSCDNNTDDGNASDSDCTPVIISESIFQNLTPSQLFIEELSIDGDCLTLKINLTGCDDDHTVDLISDGGIDESLPVQITFALRDNKLQDCEAIFLIEKQFDLLPIRGLADGDIMIRFVNSDKTILYPV